MMKAYFFALLVSATFVVSTAASFNFDSFIADPTRRCPTFTCQKDFDNPNGCSKQAFTDEGMQLWLRSCNTSAVCDVPNSIDEEGVCTDHYTTPKFYPGEYCRHDAECYTFNCQNSTCVGKPVNDNCTDDTECNAGLYCKNAVCVPTLAEKADCDLTLNKCGSNLVCDSGKCVKIGSKAVDEPVTVPGACSTFYAVNGKCAEGPNLRGDDQKCPASLECEYTLGTGSFKEPCTCGMTATGARFCNWGRGDLDMSDVSPLFF